MGLCLLRLYVFIENMNRLLWTNKKKRARQEGGWDWVGKQRPPKKTAKHERATRRRKVIEWERQLSRNENAGEKRTFKLSENYFTILSKLPMLVILLTLFISYFFYFTLPILFVSPTERLLSACRKKNTKSTYVSVESRQKKHTTNTVDSFILRVSLQMYKKTFTNT